MKKGKPFGIESDFNFSPVPHELLRDDGISAQAVRLWGMLYMLRWENKSPVLTDLCVGGGLRGLASVSSGLKELVENGWLEWRKYKNVERRFHLKAKKTSPHSVGKSLAARLQDALNRGVPEDELRRIVTEYQPEAKPGDSSFDAEAFAAEYGGCADSAEEEEEQEPDETVRFLEALGVMAAWEFAGMPLEQVRARAEQFGSNTGALVTQLRRDREHGYEATNGRNGYRGPHQDLDDIPPEWR
jgi:hypothetical protein